jgi:invasion protein IalB
MPNSGHSLLVSAIILLSLLSEDSVRAQMPQRTSATYGDWTLSCAITSNAKKSCGLVQLARDKSAAVQIGIGRAAGEDGKIVFTVQTVANVWLPDGVTLTLGADGPTISAFFEWCSAGRCLANNNLNEFDVEKLRAQKDPARLSYKNAAHAEITIPVSFVGFNDAMEALQKQ